MSWKYRWKSAVSGLSGSRFPENHSAGTSGPPAIPPRIPSRPVPPPPSKLPPAVVRSLRLLSKCMLEASICLPGGGETVQCRFHLDDVLGNDNGNFSTTGKHFSQSSRNVRLVDYSLWAELASMDGRWQYDVVGLALTLPVERDQNLQVQIVEYNAGYSPSLTSLTSRLSATAQEDVRNLRLISGFLLTADCLQQDGSYASSFLDLDGYVGNSSGQFSRGVNFTESSQDISLVSTTLRGRLSPNGGVLRESSMDISRNVRCLGGRLIAFNGLRSEDDYPLIPVDSFVSAGQLAGCKSVRLVNGSILLANYYTSKGGLRECAFKLRKIFGVADGQLRPFGHNFTPGSAKNLHFSGSILSMEIEQPTKDNYTNEEKSRSYKEYVVDLEDYVVFEDGRLKLYAHSL
jgi:CVNH domain